MKQITDCRKDFPVLSAQGANEVIYLDSAATTQRPNSVIDAVAEYYRRHNANPHRGAYGLSVDSTRLYEDARRKVGKFIGAEHTEEIIFVKSSTEAANMLAISLGEGLSPGDEIVITVQEHHSNLVPWQQVTKRKGAVLKYIYLDEEGTVPASEIENKITSKTKIVAFAHCSNVMGTVSPVKEIIEKAKSVGAVTILDGAQSVPHMPVDVKALDVDFMFFSGHKMLAPFGIGVLYGKIELLKKIPPFLYGGDMIEYVTEESATFAPVPEKFEGGTQNVGGAVGLSAAIDYLEAVGMENIEKYEKELGGYALEKMLSHPHITVYGPKSMDKRTGIISFNIEGCHPHDVATILDSHSVAIRSGHHCAQPLMKYLGVNSTCRMSLYFYNTQEDIDRLMLAINDVRRRLGYES